MKAKPAATSLSPDVLIIGGGAAGIAAAKGASNNGLSVTLVEKNEYLGGRATASQVGTVCGLYFTGKSEKAVFITDGFPKIFAEQLMLTSDSIPVKGNNGIFYLPYNPKAFQQTAEFFLNDDLISILYNTEITSAQYNSKSITSLETTIQGKAVAFNPKCIIDASGIIVPNLKEDSGYIQSEDYQAAARVFTVTGLDVKEESLVQLTLIRTLKKGVESKLLPDSYKQLSVVPGSLKNGSVLLKFGIPQKVNFDKNQDTILNSQSAESIRLLFDYLKQNTELFQSSVISSISDESGIRTGPRYHGNYVLQKSDVLSGRKFDDAIARSSWPIEYWEPGKDVALSYLREGDYYEIPSRCLYSNKIDNLFFAGKNISASEMAIASARVMGTCLQTGFAAGVLAAGYCQRKSMQECISYIRSSLFPESIKL